MTRRYAGSFSASERVRDGVWFGRLIEGLNGGGGGGGGEEEEEEEEEEVRACEGEDVMFTS